MSPKREEGEDSASALSAFTSLPEAQQPHIRRRARQRHAGPPQLQFVTATDPAQFKDEKTKRSVRSQAMMQYRYQTSEQKRKSKDSSPPAVDSQTAKTVKGGKLLVRPVNRIAPVPPNDEQAYRTSQFVTQWLEEPRGTLNKFMFENWRNENANAPCLAQERGSTTQQHGNFAMAEPSTPYSASSAVVALRNLQARISIPGKGHWGWILTYEDTDALEQEWLRIIAATVPSPRVVGDGGEPFAVIPQFKNPELDVCFLLRRCNRAFSSKVALEAWIPLMLSDPHIFLSSTSMATTWLDMLAGICAVSKRTALVKQEVIGYINERLRDSRAMEDSTLVIILHLMEGELWSCNEETLRIHQKALERLIAYRGGMSQLGGGGFLAVMAADITYLANIICEEAPLPLFYEWNPPPFTLNQNVAIPESPLYCPGPQFVTIVQNHDCSRITHNLLCDMRNLTDLFINHHSTFNAIHDAEMPPNDPPQGHSSAKLCRKFAEIRATVAALPSAHVPGLPTTNDWIYEACRLCAIIYASAMIMQVPFSAVAESHNNIIMQDIIALPDSYESNLQFVPRVTETLYEVLERTNIGDVWYNMSGVLLWVTLVGAAAARTAVNIDLYYRPTCTNDAYATWVRRCLIMMSARTTVMKVFEHPHPLIHNKRRLLRIQEILARGKDNCSLRRDGHAKSLPT